MVRMSRILILGAAAFVLACASSSDTQGPDDASSAGDLADVPGADVPVDPDVPVAADVPGEVPVEDPGAPSDPGADPAPADVPSDVAYDVPPDAPIGMCCSGLSMCGKGLKCVSTPGAFQGTCLPIPAAGDCWSGTDCAPGQVCLGSILCACDNASEGLGCNIPGTCQDEAPGCCDSDGDCQALKVCAPGNTCLPVQDAGKCWRNADCGMGQTCEGAVLCGCDVVCGQPNQPGVCTPVPFGCCYADEDCGEGLVCRGSYPGDGDPGTCVPAPNGPECLGDVACCWTDADCPGGKCTGESLCGCIALCSACGACQPDQMGTCASYDVDVELSVVQSGCDLGDSGAAFHRFFVELSWTTSEAATSQIEFAMNAFGAFVHSSTIDETPATVHSAVVYFSHMHFGHAPKAGEKLLLRARATTEAGGEGLSDPVEVTLDEAAAACLYPYDATCSDGGMVTCRPIPGPCDADKVLAARDGCLQCVYPATCTCDDGSAAECTIEPPDCGAYNALAVQDGCWRCVEPMTCKPLVR